MNRVRQHLALLLAISLSVATTASALSEKSGEKDLLDLAHQRAPSVTEEKLHTELVTSRDASDRVSVLLGLADLSFRERKLSDAAQYTEQAVGLRAVTTKELRPLVDLFQARVLDSRGDFDSILPILAQWAERSDENHFHPQIARLYFRALAHAGIPALAFEYFKRYRTILTNPPAPDTEDDLLTLWDRLDIRDDAAAIEAIATFLMTRFPTTPSSRQAFARVSSSECIDESMHKGYWENSQSRDDIAKRLVRDYGVRSDLRQLGLALMGVSEESLLPNVPIDGLAISYKEELLNQADLLLASWEYPVALNLLKYLEGAKEYGGKFQRDKILLSLGRTLNQLERYEEAVRYYKEVIEKNRSRRDVRQAKERFLLSLHYAQRFDEEIAWIKKLQTKRHPLKEDWQLFWAQYLSNKNLEATKTANGILKKLRRTNTILMRSRVNYWLARISERTGKSSAAIARYRQMASESATNHYSILARWRLSFLSGSEKSALEETLMPPTLPPHLNAETPPRPDKTELSLAMRLANVGLGSYAWLLLGTSLPSFSNEDGILEHSFVAQEAQRYKLGITLVDPLISTAIVKGFSEKELAVDLQEKRQFWTLAFPRPYEKVVESASKILGLSNSLIYSIIRTESMFNPAATSSVGALGLMQIIPRTGLHIARLLADNTFVPSQLSRENLNITYGSWYLKRLTRYYQGNYLLAVAAYNAGPLAVDRWLRQNPKLELDEFLENIPYEQTYAYVPKIMNYMNMYSRLYSGKREPIALDLPRQLASPVTSIEIF